MNTSILTPHAAHAARVGLAVPCAAWHINFGGACLNCGYVPPKGKG